MHRLSHISDYSVFQISANVEKPYYYFLVNYRFKQPKESQMTGIQSEQEVGGKLNNK